MKYLVKRIHLGDKMYEVGEEREANPNDVAHLVVKGVLEIIEEAESAVKSPSKKVKTNDRPTNS
ncbi:hypothetical protein [Acinetobacter sp. CFCC 10889]|uniref:hypothetical protein n=1 Tax=Acinetobacter sp. CFCC 10889 TaxID=1775557 RepID=UPI000DD0B236|nr:hypothetical protein [Acinetobacter sp. CFCC 10889]